MSFWVESRKKGFASVSYVEREQSDPTLLDALTVILENKDCNLGMAKLEGRRSGLGVHCVLIANASGPKPYPNARDYLPRLGSCWGDVLKHHEKGGAA